MAEDKGPGTTDKGAAAGGAPISDKKAADTSEAYQKAAGLEGEPASDNDPVIDSITEATADIEQPEPQTALINPLYEQQRAESFEARGDDEDEDEVEDEDVPDADHPEVGSHIVAAEESGDEKAPAKKTAAKKS